MNFTNGTTTNIQNSRVLGDVRYGLDHPTVMLRADGRFLMIYDYRTSSSTTYARRLLARTSADGITWGEGVTLPASSVDNSPGTGQPFQGVTGLATMGDGSIRAYYAAAGALVGSARTTDGGATWTQDAGSRLGVLVYNTLAYGDAAINDVDGTLPAVRRSEWRARPTGSISRTARATC